MSPEPKQTTTATPENRAELDKKFGFDESNAKALLSLGHEKFTALYEGMHSEAAETLHKIRQDPYNLEATISEETKLGMNQVNQNYAEDLERMTPGEFMITYSATHSPEAEALYTIYNPSALVNSPDPTTNAYGIERLQEMLFGGDVYDEDRDLNEEEKKQKKNLAELADAFQDLQEEQREELSKQQEDFLRSQHITSSDGKQLSVLDIVRAMDKVLDNWDDSFNEMVEQGIAKPKDKDSLYKNLTKYRNTMADPNLSEQEKQKLREQMIRDGRLTQEQMDYADQKAQCEQTAITSKMDANQIDRATSTETEKSVTKRVESLVEKENSNKTSGFSTSVSGGIKSNITPTENFNTKAGELKVEEQKPEIKPAVANANSAPALSAFS